MNTSHNNNYSSSQKWWESLSYKHNGLSSLLHSQATDTPTGSTSQATPTNSSSRCLKTRVPDCQVLSAMSQPRPCSFPRISRVLTVHVCLGEKSRESISFGQPIKRNNIMGFVHNCRGQSHFPCHQECLQWYCVSVRNQEKEGPLL